MPLFSFRVQCPERSSNSDPCEFASHDEAWVELKKVCADLVGTASRALEQNAEWRMELLDAFGVPLFRICLVAEALK